MSAGRGRAGDSPADRERRMESILRGGMTGLARSPRAGTVRVFHPVEVARLSPAARGLLIRLTAEGTITHRMREQAVSVALWLDQPDVSDGEMEQILRTMSDRREKSGGPAAPTPPRRSERPQPDPRRWN